MSFQRAFFLLVFFFLLSALAVPAGAQTCAPPSTRTVNVCAPAEGSTVASPVRVWAAGPAGTQFMQVYVDGAKVREEATAAIDWDFPMSNGAHRVTVQAKDAAGYFKTSRNINVGTSSGGSCTPPDADQTVRICAPADGATTTSPVTISASARDADGVSYMQIYVDGAFKGQFTGSSLDTSLAMSTGQHRLTVQARDAVGNYFKTSHFITVTSSPLPPGLDKVKHIIFYMQENRSFDQYFGRMGQYRRDRGFNDAFDELPLNVALPDTAGHMISPFHFRTVCHENLSPGWNESHYSYNNGAMNNFLRASPSVPSTLDPHGTRGMGYYDWTDLPYYYELAFQFATSDRFFSSLLAPTIPNRMYLFAATSFGHIRPDAAPAGGWKQKTIFDAMTEAGVTWRYYYQDSSVYLPEWDTWNRDSGKVRHIDNYFADLANGTLPSVVFLERASQLGLDEHPGTNPQRGAAKTKQILDALMNSSAWSSSVFILLFDEGGGFYDHVPPPAAPKPDGIAPMLRTGDLPGDFDRLGFRVPFIIVSPFVKPHFVSHTTRDITSVLKLIETRFGLQPLTQRDAWADNMVEFFDFDNPQWLTPPSLPAQPTNGVCDRTLETAPNH